MPATKPKKNMDDKLDDRTVFQKFISATKPSFPSWFSTKTSYAAAGCKFRIEDDHGEVFVTFRGTANLEKLGMRGGWTKEKNKWGVFCLTLLETNVAPEKVPSQKETSFTFKPSMFKGYIKFWGE